jgi:intracellular sulfur oxidation DsrE/DsrF family protein
MTQEDEGTIARRTVVAAAIGTGVVALGAAAVARDASAKDARWQPTLEKDDDWMELPSRHRIVFDATSSDGAAHALFFARNYIGVNKSDYGVDHSQLATIIVLRHMGTVFGYNDEIWAKYGKVLSNLSNFTDPKTKEAPTRNLYDVKGYGPGLANADATVSELAAQGVHFAVCGSATQRVAATVAAETKSDAEAIRQELVSHLVPNARIVAAGIVAVNRAQERGYAVSYYTT